MDKIEVELLDKHRNYLQYYKPNDTYWGLGIEHETYFEMSQKIIVNPQLFYTENVVKEIENALIKIYASNINPEIVKGDQVLIDIRGADSLFNFEKSFLKPSFF
jgi:hypothetical protein